ncbi:hypothetical protein Leryth_001061 [Lithospermum erythrorhizon]|nr:hypothetical protein Leryth_001061 [Lithospermum erythrorhizon]
MSHKAHAMWFHANNVVSTWLLRRSEIHQSTIPASLSELPKLDRNKLTGSSLTRWRTKLHNCCSSSAYSQSSYFFFYSNFNSRNRLEGDASFLFGKNKTIQVADFSRNLFRRIYKL